MNLSIVTDKAGLASLPARTSAPTCFDPLEFECDSRLFDMSITAKRAPVIPALKFTRSASKFTTPMRSVSQLTSSDFVGDVLDDPSPISTPSPRTPRPPSPVDGFRSLDRHEFSVHELLSQIFQMICLVKKGLVSFTTLSGQPMWRLNSID